MSHWFLNLPIGVVCTAAYPIPIAEVLPPTEQNLIPINPALTVRGERYAPIEGKTPKISGDQARHLLDSIDTTKKVGLRDKAIIATPIYTAARAGAVARLQIRDLVWDGSQYSLRFLEKGGKSRQIPVRHDLQRFILEYLGVFRPNPATEGIRLFFVLPRVDKIY